MKYKSVTGTANGIPIMVLILGLLAHQAHGFAAEEPAVSPAGNAKALEIEVGLMGAGDRRVEVRPLAVEWITGEIGSFAVSHPEIRVTTSTLGDERDAVPLYDRPSLPRNIVGLSSEAGYEVVYLANREDIVPIDKFLPDSDFSKDLFYDALWEPVTYNGKIWGVPWATTLPVLVCNWPLFEKAGIASPPKTWDELLADAAALTKDTDGDGNIDQLGCYIPRFVYEYLAGHVAIQEGVEFFKGNAFANWTERHAKCFSFTASLKSALDALEAKAVQGATYAMTVAITRDDIAEGGTALNGRRNRGYRLAYLPSNGKDSIANFDTLYLAVRRSTPEQERASWELIKWISRRDVALPHALGGYPARKDFIERDDFKAVLGNWYQDVAILWKSNARLKDFGYCPLVGRYTGLRTLAGAIGFGALSGAEAENAWNAQAATLNKQLPLLKGPDINSYKLFK